MIPETSNNFSGVFSIINSVFSPNFSTIRSAVTGPIPLIISEARYALIPAAVSGIQMRKEDTSNCIPYFVSFHSPSNSTSTSAPVGSSIPTA